MSQWFWFHVPPRCLRSRFCWHCLLISSGPWPLSSSCAWRCQRGTKKNELSGWLQTEVSSWLITSCWWASFGLQLGWQPIWMLNTSNLNSISNGWIMSISLTSCLATTCFWIHCGRNVLLILNHCFFWHRCEWNVVTKCKWLCQLNETFGQYQYHSIHLYHPCMSIHLTTFDQCLYSMQASIHTWMVEVFFHCWENIYRGGL